MDVKKEKGPESLDFQGFHLSRVGSVGYRGFMPGIFCSRELTEGIDGGPESVRARLGELLPDNRIVCLRQVHSDRIVTVEDAPFEGFPEADGVVSADPSTVLCIRTADCVPVLLWDEVLQVSGALHAGWRGLALGIVAKGLDLMRSMGCRDIHVGLGPAIGPCCYTVGPEVVRALGTEPSTSSTGSLSVDLHAVALRQATAFGVDPLRIHVLRSCTCCTASYFSYRRDGPAAGRNLSLIGGDACSLPGLPAL